MSVELVSSVIRRRESQRDRPQSEWKDARYFEQGRGLMKEVEATMNRSQAVTDTLDKPADSTVTVSLRFRLGPIFRGRLAVEALALALGFFMSAANSNAQVSNYWTGASGDWTNGLNWSTNS